MSVCISVVVFNEHYLQMPASFSYLTSYCKDGVFQDVPLPSRLDDCVFSLGFGLRSKVLGLG